MLNVKYKRFIKQTIPFGVTWLVFATIYAFLEKGILGNINYYPSTGNIYDFHASLIYAGAGSFFVGMIQGWIEVVWLRKRFEDKALWVKIVLKSTFYLFFIILFLVGIATIANSILMDVGIFDPGVLHSLYSFITTFAFWSVLIYIAVTLIIALFLSEIGEYFGNEVLYNFLFGKYHRPKQETRIFMFLDMKSSTTIAERIGHKRYFELIKEYYADMTNAILETSGEIYQYVGDEIVVSWPEKRGLYKNNCIQCFHKICKTFEKKKEVYVKKFGLVPAFKAGYHIGEVTTGEIGIIKRDIIYTGDVLNTTARIQAECNTYNTKILISEELVLKLKAEDSFSCTKIGKLMLRGKTEPVQLYSISF